MQDDNQNIQDNEASNQDFSNAALLAAQAKSNSTFSEAFPVESALNSAEEKEQANHHELDYNKFNYKAKDLPSFTMGDEPFKPGDYAEEKLSRAAKQEEKFREAIERIAAENEQFAKYRISHFDIRSASGESFAKISSNGTVTARTTDINNPAFAQYVAAAAVHRFSQNDKPVFLWVNEAKMLGGPENIEKFFRTQIELLDANGIDIDRLRIQNKSYQWILDEYKQPKMAVTQDETLAQETPANAPAELPKGQEVEVSNKSATAEQNHVSETVAQMDSTKMTISEFKAASPMPADYEKSLINNYFDGHAVSQSKTAKSDGIENPYDNLDYTALGLDEPAAKPAVAASARVHDELAYLDSNEHESILDLISESKSPAYEDDSFVHESDIPDALADIELDAKIDSEKEFMKMLEDFDVDSVNFSKTQPQPSNTHKVDELFRQKDIDDELRKRHKTGQILKFER